MSTLAIIDAYSLAHRALGGPPSSHPAPRFFSRLGEIYGDLNPTHMVLALDNDSRTLVRRERSPAYKANRPPKPEAVSNFLEELWACCGVLGIPMRYADRWEADDVMATYASAFRGGVDEVFIVTPDKDMCQCVIGNVRVYDYTMKEIVDWDSVRSRLGVPPTQVADYLALVGDRADGIAGVRGVGPVKARKLLAQFGTIEDIIHEEAFGPLSDDHAESLRLSKYLATVNSSLPVSGELDDLRCRPLDSALAHDRLVKLRATISLRASRLPLLPRSQR